MEGLRCAVVRALGTGAGLVGCVVAAASLAAVWGCSDERGSAERAHEADVVSDVSGRDEHLVDPVEAGGGDDPVEDAVEDSRVPPEVEATQDADDLEEELPFVVFAGTPRRDPRTTRLCEGWDTPDDLDDKVYVSCALEGENVVPAPDPVPDELVVMTWNLERGGSLDAQIALLRDSEDVPRPDILLVSEVDRGCSRSGHRHVTRELAEALEMNWVFVVEFVELPRGAGAGGRIDETCEHGNAVLSRFPLGNVGGAFHRSNRSWFLPPEQRERGGEPRLGGRSWVRADTLVGTRRVSLWSVHFESDVGVLDVQVDQAVETAELAIAHGGLAFVGGDFNSPGYWLDIARGADGDPERVRDRTVGAFLTRGFFDPLRGQGRAERSTRGALVLDFLLPNRDLLYDGTTCPVTICTPNISDHQAVWARWRP